MMTLLWLGEWILDRSVLTAFDLVAASVADQCDVYRTLGCRKAFTLFLHGGEFPTLEVSATGIDR